MSLVLDVESFDKHVNLLVHAYGNMIANAKNDNERQYYIGCVKGVSQVIEVIKEYKEIENSLEKMQSNWMTKFPTNFGLGVL